MSVWTNSLTDSRVTGDLKRHDAYFYTIIGKPVVGLAALKTAMMTNGKNYHTMYDTKPNIQTQTTGIH